jgi:hypothetical protein
MAFHQGEGAGHSGVVADQLPGGVFPQEAVAGRHEQLMEVQLQEAKPPGQVGVQTSQAQLAAHPLAAAHLQGSHEEASPRLVAREGASPRLVAREGASPH